MHISHTRFVVFEPSYIGHEMTEVFSQADIDWLLSATTESLPILPQPVVQPSFQPLPMPSELGKSAIEVEPEPALPLPSKRLMRLANYLRIGFALFVLGSTLIGLTGCTSVASVPWQKATEVISTAALEQLIQTQTSLQPETVGAVKDAALVWKVQGKKGDLALVNFNTPQVCGSLGCQYTALWLKSQSAPQTVLSAYFKPTLPKTVPLFEPAPAEAPNDTSPLPCFTANQLEATNLRRSTLCFLSERYRVVSSTIQPLKRG